MPKDPKTGAEIETPEQIAAKAAEAKAAEEARAASTALAKKIGVNEPALTPKDLVKEGEETVLCTFPKRVPLTLDAADGHRRVEFPVGTYPIPARLATKFPNRATPGAEPILGMHFYLKAHGVTVVEAQKAATPEK